MNEEVQDDDEPFLIDGLDPKEYKRRGRQQRSGRRAHNETLFDEARALAAENGMVLKKHTDVHYSLRKGWQINIYPGNRRIWSDRKHNSPFLKLPDAWTLLDVVKAAIAKEKKNAS